MCHWVCINLLRKEGATEKQKQKKLQAHATPIAADAIEVKRAQRIKHRLWHPGSTGLLMRAFQAPASSVSGAKDLDVLDELKTQKPNQRTNNKSCIGSSKKESTYVERRKARVNLGLAKHLDKM